VTPALRVAALRGATTLESDTREQVLARTGELLHALLERNGLASDDVISLLLTATDDVRSEFPATAVREAGIADVPMLCARELDIKGGSGLPLCIRVMIHWNTDKPQNEIEHIYVRDANRLRPDLSKLPAVDWEELEAWINEHMASGEG